MGNENPFEDLPDALVHDLLDQSGEINNKLIQSFNSLISKQDIIRECLENHNYLHHHDDIKIKPFYPKFPTSCGVDGACAHEKLVSIDIYAIAGVAIEGISPKGPETRYWEKPQHISEISTVSHNKNTPMVIRTIMSCMELTLASKSPHDVVYLDGALISPFIALHQALGMEDKKEIPQNLFKSLKEHINEMIKAYLTILSQNERNQIFVGVPKYTTSKEIPNILTKCKALNSNEEELKTFEDKGFLSLILKEGEYIGPILSSTYQRDMLPYAKDNPLLQTIFKKLDPIQVIYYRPYQFNPVLRLEIPKSVDVTDAKNLSLIFESLEYQCSGPSIMEPYPLFIADKMVKQLHKALPAIRKTATQDLAKKIKKNVGDIFLSMHGYRTDSYR